MDTTNILVANPGLTIHSAGDDASLDAIRQIVLQHTDLHPNYTVLARHPNVAFDRAFDVTTVQNLEYASKEEAAGRSFRGLNHGDSHTDLLRIIECFDRSDIVVIGAGNFINENSFSLFSGFLPQIAVYVQLARLTRTPCALFGMSAAKLKNPLAIRMATWTLDAADSVSFREQDSIDILQASGVRVPGDAQVIADPVICSRTPTREESAALLQRVGITPDAGAILAIAVREFEHRGGDIHRSFVETMRAVTAAWSARGGQVLFVPQCTYDKDHPIRDDRNVARDIVSGLPDQQRLHVLDTRLWPWETESVYSAAAAALTVRLHGGVFAAKQGIPVVSLGYEPKVIGFWNEMGRAEYCLPLESSADVILETLDRSVTEFDVDENRRRVDRLRSKAGEFGRVIQGLREQADVHV